MQTYTVTMLILSATGLLFFLGLIVTWFYQDRILFHPLRLPFDHEFRSRFDTDELYFLTEDNAILNALFFHAKSPKGIALYFHGNAGALNTWKDIAADYLEKGYDVIMMDYRGYGKSRGKRSEEAINRDALLMYDYARQYYQAEQIVITGRSMGTGPASRLAAIRPAAHLILESPFTSIRKLYSVWLPVLPAILPFKFRFRNDQNLPKVEYPVSIIHGKKDNLIPIRMGRKLASLLPERARLVVIDQAAHNNLSAFPEYKMQLALILANAVREDQSTPPPQYGQGVGQ